MRQTSPASNWDEYYLDPRFHIPEYIVQVLWANYIKVLRRHLHTKGPLVVAELGGANSCIYKRMTSNLELGEFHIVDNNEVGLDFSKNLGSQIQVHNTDLLDQEAVSRLPFKADVVISAGLIEHFTPENTTRMVDAHFSLCKSGGLVLMSFPTPTFAYLWFRAFLERIGRFPPLYERPLTAKEIRPQLEAMGPLLEFYRIWSIGLTQFISLSRKP